MDPLALGLTIQFQFCIQFTDTLHYSLSLESIIAIAIAIESIIANNLQTQFTIQLTLLII